PRPPDPGPPAAPAPRVDNSPRARARVGYDSQPENPRGQACPLLARVPSQSRLQKLELFALVCCLYNRTANIMMTPKHLKYVAAILLGAALACQAADKSAAKPKPYTLKTCPVSDEKLGDMGDPYVFTHEGREIKLCCKGC